MALTLLIATIDISSGLDNLNSWISNTTVNTIESINVIGNNLLIIYT